MSRAGSRRLGRLPSEKRNLGPTFWQGILGSSTFQERMLREILEPMKWFRGEGSW